MPPAHSWLPFWGSTDFSLGVEEELHMAAPMSLRPYGGTDAVLAYLDPEVGSIAGEVSDGVLESGRSSARRGNVIPWPWNPCRPVRSIGPSVSASSRRAMCTTPS